MIQIFISHSSQDRQRCEWLKALAEDFGITAYLAEHDVKPGMSLAGKVCEAIDASDAVVVVLSDNGMASPYVHQEVGYATRARKLVIPLVGSGVEPESLAMLQGIEHIPFDFDAPHEGYARLKTALHRLVEQQQAKVARPRDAAMLVLALFGLLLLTRDG